MIEGTCPKCGLQEFGIGLLNPRYQSCPFCHVAMDITEDGVPLMKGFSPFKAEKIENQKTEIRSTKNETNNST